MMKRHARIAIMHPEKGILVVAKKGHAFNLTGGAAEQYEALKSAAVRERREEIGRAVRTTGLVFHSDHLIKKPAKKKGGKIVPEFHRVFTARLKPGAQPRPGDEVNWAKWVNSKNFGKTPLAAPADMVVPMLLGIGRRKRK